MNKSITKVVLFLGMLFFVCDQSQAQSFNGYQTIGRNTVSFSLVWSGKPYVGFSYAWRDFGTSFTDIQAELRIPIDNGFKRDEFNLRAGFYRPSRLKRTFVGTGAHLVWEHDTKSGFKDKLSGLATIIPSYVYSASLNDGLYGTTGIRLSYVPIIWSKNQDDNTAKHSILAGIHFDSHHERTLGLSFNPAYNINLGSPENNTFEGDFYFGQAYFLGRF
jgi:hypothetical protein